MPLAADARILWHLLRGAPRGGNHVQRLRKFYAPQAQGYDAFRDRLLQGRRELIEHLPAGTGARVVELGAGTGRNLEFFGDRLRGFASFELVDLCPPLLSVAKQRLDNLVVENIGVDLARKVRLIEADVTQFRPAHAVDCVYLSYALTMIPDWQRAIDNAIDMLVPGGALGVVDFHLPPIAGRLNNAFWRRWFAHDGVWLSGAHLPYLRHRLGTVYCEERYGAVPYLPGLKLPYYLFVGRKAAAPSMTSHHD
jgi:S-adenosylmethionine-diacylgycerolhomoserine-N-methlytransferase